MNGYLRSSPHFFRLIKAAFAAAVATLLLLAWFIAAPLQEAADFARVPNPSRSAWFLLWMQELVSYSSTLVYLIVAMALFFAALPWLAGRPAAAARWFARDQRWINVATLVAFIGIVALTVVAMLFRGENWSLVWPF
ncbi:MAG: cytochrome B6 [Desulfuromonadales bacterium]|nr:cytochrome B6 [Desulfuromonadales bacterium]